MPEEFDDFGIPIKKQSVASENDTHDEFGIPVKKKELSAKSEPSTSDSKTPSPLLEKSGEKADRQQTTAGNIIPSFNPNDKGLSPSEKQLLNDRDLALKRRDKEIESRNADKFVKENIGIKARTGFLQKDANGEIAKSNDNTIPSLRDSNLLPSSKYVDFGTPSAPKKGSYDEFDLKNEEEKEKRLERADIALEEGQKDAELAKLSIADKAKSYANSFLQGGFGGLASTVNLAGTVYTKTKEAITGKKDWGSRADDEIARRTLNNFQQEYIPEANALKGSLGSQVARGFGQMGAMAATATVTGGSAIIPSVSAFAETYDSESQEALKNGASESTANKVALGNAFASMGLEAIPVLRMLNRANKTTGGTTFKQIALELGKKGVKGGLEEGGTEMAQQGVSNLIAQKTYDKKRELGSGIVDAGGVGGIIGLTSTIALSALGVSLKNAKTPKEKAEIESQIAELEGLKNEAIIKEQKQIDSKKAEILASLEPDGNGGVIMTPEAKAELDKLENARVQVSEPTKQSATITEGEKPSAFASKQQEPNGKSANTEANKGATVESAVIEIGGETFEGKNHAEAILKAQQAGKDISQVDRQGEGMFKLSDGTVISREQAKETFGADKAEMLITQDEAANKANDDYEKVKTEFKREDIANKIASNDTGGIANTPIEDVPLLVEERINPKENVLTVTPIQENITLTVPQPTITGAQEQEGTTGVQALSENVQEAGTTDTEGVSVGKTSKNTIDARGKLNERAKALGYDGIKQFNTQNVLNENLNEEEKQLLDDYSSHTASVANEKDSSIIESMNDEDFGHWAKSNDVQRGANGTVNNKSDLDLAKKRINILNKRGNKKQADIEQKSLELSKKKDDWTIESWNERFDELLPQEEIDGINKERNDFNKKLNEVLNEPTKEQDIQASVLNKSGTEDSPTKKGAEQVTRKPSQEKIAEKLSKGLSALGKLSEDKKRIKSDGVFVKEKRARNKAIRELDPTNATQAARQYLLERGRLDTKSIQDETGMSLKEMNQLIGIFGTSKSHPNLEKAAENILARHEYLKDKGIEPQDIRNALIDLLSSDRTKWNEDQYNELDPEQLRKKFEASQIPEGFEYEKIGIKEPNDEVAQQDFDFQYELSDEQQQELNNLFYDTETFDAENSSTKGKSGSKRTGTDQGEYVSGNGSNDSRTSAQGGLIQKRYGNNSKSSEEVVSEINSKSLTRIEGLNMGQSQARGTYVSTEAKNRYETADKKAKKAKVKIKTPFTFKSETGIHQFRNDILREQIEQPGSILEEIDFADYRLPDPWDNVTIDDLSDSGIVKLAGLVSDKLIEEGYDSIYWPETKTHEGELVVFDRNNVEIEGDLSPKDKLALGVEALANIYGITKNAKQSDINTKQALNLIAEALYDQLGVTGNALIKAIKDYLKENKIDNLNGEVDKFKTDIINGIEEYKNIVDVQEYISEIKEKQQEKKSLLNRAYKGQTETQIKEAIAEYGLTYEVESRIEAKGIADGIISDIGLENAIEAVNRFEIQGAPAAFVLARGLDYLQAEMLKENSPEQLESLMKQQAILVDSLDVKGRTGGRFSSALDEIYRGEDFNFNFDLERQKQQYKDANNGELPKAVEDKMIQLDTELKEVSKKLKETEEKVRLLEEQNAVDSIKADISKTTAKKQRKGKALIAEGLDDIAEALGITLMASGDKRASVINGLAKIGKGMIEEGIATIENVSEKLKEFVSQKLKGKIDFNEYANEVIASINLESEIKSGKIKIKQSVIRKLVEEGANNIDELVAQLTPIVKKEYPEATEREIRDAVTSYGKIVNPQRDEIDIKIGKMKRIGRLISALEDVKEKKRPLKSGVQREKIDAEERALSKTLREAMKELPMDLESQERQLKTILESTKQRLRNQIEDLNREISTKEQIPKSAKAFRSDEEIADLKKQRDELKKQHSDIFKNDDYKERLRLDIAKRNAEKKIADFERRIKDRDLSVKRRTQVEADKELNKLKIKQLELKDEFIKLQYENELKNRTRRQKVIDGLFEAWGLTRALRATGEMSFILLQGGVYTVSHPVTAAKAFTTAMSHFGSETRADNWLRKLKTTEQYMIMKESKLALVEPDAKLSVREEQFLGGWVNHIWDFGGYPLKLAGEKTYENWKKANPIKAIERAGVGYMNTLRVERFLQGEIMLQEQGKTILNNKEDYKNMADVINTFTGRATLGAFESVSKPLSAIFFSPRNWASTIKTATPYGLYHFGKMTSKTESGKMVVSVAQKMAVRDFMTFVGTTGAIVSLAAVALADDDDEKTGVEFDPTSSDFMKIKLGNTRVDPWGGKIQQVILLSRLMTQSMKKADGKSYVLGYGNTSSSGELLAKMATNKLAPSASILNKLLFADKKKVKGEYVLNVPFEGEYDAAEQLAANLYPIYWDSIKETYAEQPEVLASFLSALAFMGMGVNTYEQKQKDKKSK